MRPETRTVKDALKKQFPGCKVNIIYITAYNYAFSDDKLVIKIDVPYKDVADFIRMNSYKIRIIPKGSYSSAVNDFDQTLFGQDTDIGFIEIESTVDMDSHLKY